MTKTLTQDVFRDAPDWARSAAIDEDGHAFMNNYPKSNLYIGQLAGIGAHLIPLDKPDIKIWFIGKGYDTTHWQHSAIDRE